PLGAREKARQILVLTDRADRGGIVELHGPCGCRDEVAAGVISQEQHASWTRKDLRNRTHRRAPHVLLLRRGQRLDEPQPFDAIVVLVPVEMLADEYGGMASQGSRSEQSGQSDGGAGKEHELSDAAPGTAELSYVIPADGHDEQIRPDDEEGRRIENDLTRNEEIERPVRRAPSGDGYQRHGCRDEQRARIPGFERNTA